MKPLDLSIGQRLTIGFGLLLLTLIAFAVAISIWNRHSVHAQQAFVERIDPMARRADDLERSLLYVGLGTRAFLFRPDEQRLQLYRRYAKDAAAALEQLERTSDQTGNEAAYRHVEPLVTPYLDMTHHLVDARVKGLVPEEEEELTRLRERALQSVQQLTNAERKNAESALAAMAAARDKVTGGLASAALLAILLSLGVAYFTMQSIRRPTRELLAAAAAAEQGNWHPALKLAPTDSHAGAGGHNEMIRLSRALGSLAVTLEQRERRLQAKRDVAHATASSLDKEPLITRALAAIMGYVGAEVGVIFAFDPQSQTLYPLAQHALSVTPARLRLGEGIPGAAAKERRTILMKDIPRDSGFSVKIGFDESPPRSLAATPISFGEQLHGVLLVASLRDLNEDARTFIESGATQIGVGLQNIVEYEEVQRLLAEVRDKNQQILSQNEVLQAQNEQIQTQSEEIQAQNEELKQQSDELRLQTQALAEADERKNQFLGVLAHELRNPMAPITNSLVILRRTPPGSEQALRAQTVIERQTRHLNRLIDDLLDITRISQGKIRIQRERLDLVEIVHACVEDQRAALESRAIQLALSTPQTPIPVHGDQTRLSQVLGNLLSNAIKFTDRAGHITLTLRATDAQKAVLRVADDGVGIDPSLLPRLFQPFSQGVSDHSRTNSGLGLGLALVKALVALHGGTVEARSAGTAKGSEFIVTLPLARSESLGI